MLIRLIRILRIRYKKHLQLTSVVKIDKILLKYSTHKLYLFNFSRFTRTTQTLSLAIRYKEYIDQSKVRELELLPLSDTYA